jgi:predicted nucleotidyltransferase component of viral defense system
MRVSKEEFELALRGVEESGRETYSNGNYNAFYSIGSGRYHKLLGTYRYSSLGRQHDVYDLYHFEQRGKTQIRFSTMEELSGYSVVSLDLGIEAREHYNLTREFIAWVRS